MTVQGTISYDGTTLYGYNLPSNATSHYNDGTYFKDNYWVIGGRTTGGQWNYVNKVKMNDFTAPKDTSITIDLNSYPYDEFAFFNSSIGTTPDLANGDGMTVNYRDETSTSYSTSINTLGNDRSPEYLHSSSPAEVSITVNPTNGIGYASSIIMDTQVVHSIQGIAEGMGGALPTTVQLLDILQINGLASGVGGTTGLVQVIQNVSRIISGVVNLNSSPTEGATVIAVEPTLLKSYKATTVSDGTYEIYVNDIGTYHVLAVFEDGVGNKYGAMIQPFVAITE